MGMYAVLEITSGAQQGTKLEVRPGQTLKVGRHAQADVVIREDAMMSNVHFALACDGANCRIHDLKSRFGMQVNQARVTEAAVRDGDRIVAGSTTFVVRIVGDPTAPKATDQPEAPTPAEVNAATNQAPEPWGGGAAGEPAAIHTRVIQELRRQPEPLYALLDAARDPLILARLVHSGEEYQSLYEGPQGEAMAAFGPFLVKLPKESPFLETLVREAWGKSWGVYLTCAQPFQEVRKHFRRFLTVELEGHGQVYFRYYDPRVLRFFLPTFTPPQVKELFGPVRAYLMEANGPETLLQFTLSPQRGAIQEPVPMAAEALKRIEA